MFQKKKKDKKNAKFLSMILETDEEDEKKV